VDLLALPPPPKKVTGWTLRTMTPLAYDVTRLPYPIPAAGASLEEADEVDTEAPPVVLTYKLPSDLVLVEREPKVGWWDDREEEWRTEVGPVAYCPPRHMMPFTSRNEVSKCVE